MAEETRIVKIEIDQTEALKSLEQSEVAMLNLKDAQKELNDSLKAGNITQAEYAAQKVQLDQQVKKETESRKTLTQAINTESNSLAAQKLKLKELVAERDKIDRSTVEGAKKFDTMNKSINDLSGSIKKAEEQGGSFQRNVGNYKGTIDQFTGGAASAAMGLASMTKAALAFIATPIGAIIAAIGLAISALMAYFKGSEEGQNRWNKIMAAGGQILERFQDIMEDLGELVFNVGKSLVNAFSNPKKLMQDLVTFLKDQVINRFTAFARIAEGIADMDFKKVANGVLQFQTGVVDVIGKVGKLKDAAVEYGEKQVEAFDGAIAAGFGLADMQAQLDKQERQFIEDASARRLQISELRRKADESEGENKLKFLNEALALEKKNADEQLKNVQLKRDIAAEEVKLNGATKEALDKLAQSEADLNNAKASYFEETRKMNKERLSTEEAIDKQILTRIDNEEALAQKEAERVAKSLQINETQLEKSLENIEKEEAARDKDVADTLSGLVDIAETDIEKNDEATEKYIEGVIRRREELDAFKKHFGAIMQETLAVGADINAKAANIRAHQMAIDLQNVKLDEQAKLKALQERLDKGEISEEEFAEQKTQIQKDSARAEDDIKRKAFDANKKNRIADSIIDAIQSGIAAFRSLAGIPIVGPILAAAAAAAAVAFGYKQVDLIRQEQYIPGGFALGGYTGDGAVHEYAGPVHKGEVVWSQRDVAAVGGPQIANSMRPTYAGYADGGIATSMMTGQIDRAMMNAGMMPDVYLSLKELGTEQTNMAIKVQLTEA